MDRIAEYFSCKSKLKLKEVQQPLAPRKPSDKITSAVIRQSGSQIYSRRHPLLSALGPNVYAEKIDSKSARRRIRSKYVSSIVQTLLERALQIITALPAKDPKFAANDRPIA
jgi:hypothetical protein